MISAVQVFDYYRDDQGILHFGLYDQRSGLIINEAISNDVHAAGAENSIPFLERCWRSWDKPLCLLMTADKIRKSLVEFFDAERITLRFLPSTDSGRIKKIFTGETPVPPGQG